MSGVIALGLSHIKNISEATVKRIVEARPPGGYSTIYDALAFAKIHPAEAETLALAGAFASFGFSRPEALWRIRLYFAASRLKMAKSIAPALPGVSPDFPVPKIKEYSRQTILELERQNFGFYLSAHPVAIVRPHAGYGVIYGRDLALHVGEEVTLLGWLIHAKRTRTVHGDFMKFLTLEDETAIFEATLFPKIYRRTGHVLTTGRGPYLVTGKAEDDHGDVTVTANGLRGWRP